MNERSRSAKEPNIVPIPPLPKLPDSAYLQAHELIDRIPPDELRRLIPWLRGLAELDRTGLRVLRIVVGKTFAPPWCRSLRLNRALANRAAQERRILHRIALACSTVSWHDASGGFGGAATGRKPHRASRRKKRYVISALRLP